VHGEHVDESVALALLENAPGAQVRAWRRFSPVVRRTVERRLGYHADVDDIVQDVFLSLFGSVHRLRCPMALRSFVVRIAARKAGEELRRRRTRALLFPDGEELRWAATYNADAAVHRALFNLQALINRLTIKQRQAFVLRYVEGRRAEQVATILGVSTPTIRRSLARAREKIELWAGRDSFLNEYVRSLEAVDGGASGFADGGVADLLGPNSGG
jgi:RNA polymerase sigma-70 factor, ECF subfamily